ncbi:MAG: histidine kinase [Candidatus Limivivens sp.]|nr:histidine kinase [Candidatus Limivivens sp.]
MGQNKHTLKHQVKRLAWGSNLVLLFFLIIFLVYLVLTNQYQINRNVKETSEILHSEVVNYQNEIEKIASLVAYNGLILRISNTNDLSSMTRTANDIRDMLDILTASNENISGIVLTNFGHLVLGIESSSYKTLYAVEEYIAVHPDEKFAHLNFYNEETKEQEYLYFQRSLSSSKDGQYYTIVVYQIDVLQGFLEEMNPSEKYQIVDENGKILAENVQEGEQTEAYGAEVSIHLDGLEWDIIGRARKYYCSTQFLTFLEIAVLVFLFFAVWTGIMAKLIIKNMTDPITTIAEFMKSYSFAHESRQRLELQTHNELLQIGNGINEMLNELETTSSHLIQAREMIYRTKMEKQKSELIALQIQINPHFLFNTLNCINGIAAAHHETDISTIVIAMASIMRYSLGGEKFVPLNLEMECVQNYCRIIQVRFQNRVQMEYDLDEASEHRIVPKMILQPIVENAVCHGLEMCRGNGNLLIRSWLEGKWIMICVENTGPELSKTEEAALNECLERYVASSSMEIIFAEKHIGMRNVHARLRMLYGEEAGVCFRAREGGGAAVTLKIPCTDEADTEVQNDKSEEKKV